MSHLSHLWTKV